MTDATQGGEGFVCCGVFRPCYGPSCKHRPQAVTPTDSRGAEAREMRTEAKVEWCNVYRYQLLNGEWAEARVRGFKSREDADTSPWFSNLRARTGRYPRIAVERIETVTTITRHPLGGTERE